MQRIDLKNRELGGGSIETAIVFTTFGRDEIALKSIKSLREAISHKGRAVRIIVSEASPNPQKTQSIRELGIEDVLWTPGFTSAATSRNIAVQYLLDKYAPQFICFVEDDFEYTNEWYDVMVKTTIENYGVISPLGLAYGVFSASPHRLEQERIEKDEENGLTAYIFGAVADQRFMPLSHYLSVMRMWDPDILGISYCQTGMQTSRNVMRGYCGGIITDRKLCWPMPEQESTWSNGKRDVGPPAHDMDVSKFDVIRNVAMKASYKAGD